MKNMPIYEALAQAFAAEGVDTQFILMGDGKHAPRDGDEESRRHEHLRRPA